MADRHGDSRPSLCARAGQAHSAAPVFGYVRADYWLRFAIDNTAARDQDLLLELDSLYEAVELRVFIAARDSGPIRFFEEPDHLGRAGRLVAEPVRYLAHRNPVFAFRLPANTRAYLVLRTAKATVRRYLAYIGWLLAMAVAQLTMDRTAQELIESVWSGYRD